MSKKRVLMVDDEAGLTRMVKAALETRGQYTVQPVNNSRDAISTAHSFKPDVILLDLIMPGMDGAEVANQLRGEPELRDIPIIFLTATARGKEADHDGLVSGGYVFLSKPVALADLVHCIETSFAAKGSPPPTDPPATGSAPENQN